MKRITKEHIEMLTRRELSGRWRVSTETLKRKEKAGLLQSLRIGRGVRYRLRDVLAFEDASEVAR
jgi:DNA-binding transcriptional ArsR family regulator